MPSNEQEHENNQKGMYFLDESLDELQKKWDEEFPHDEWMKEWKKYAAKWRKQRASESKPH